MQSSLLSPAALPSAILTLMFKPYQRGIYCDDQSISYPYRRDTISHGVMASVTITCSIVIVSLNISSVWQVLSHSYIHKSDKSYLCFSTNHYQKYVFPYYLKTLHYVSSIHRSPRERPTLCTQIACTPTPSSTSTCQLFIRWWEPSCLEELSANRWLTWPSSL